MQLVDFPETNTIIAKDQPQYNPMPAYVDGCDAQGRIICCWHVSFWEAIKILFRGEIWHQVLTFNQSIQPQLLTVDKPEMDQVPIG